MVERFNDDVVKYAVERAQIRREARFFIDRGSHGDFEPVIVAVPVRIGARAEDRAVALVAPVRPVVAVRSGEADPAGEKCVAHVPKVDARRGSVQSEARNLRPRRCDNSRRVSFTGEAAHSHE